MASPVPVSAVSLVREILDVQITLLEALTVIRTYQDERKELALKIAQVEKSGCASTEDLKSLGTWKRLLREKDELIRTLQAKVATVKKNTTRFPMNCSLRKNNCVILSLNLLGRSNRWQSYE